MVNGGGLLFGNHGAGILHIRKLTPLSLVLGSKVLGLQLGQGLHHARDEGFVAALLYSVDFSLPPILNFERHQSRNGV